MEHSKATLELLRTAQEALQGSGEWVGVGGWRKLYKMGTGAEMQRLHCTAQLRGTPTHPPTPLPSCQAASPPRRCSTRCCCWGTSC